MSSLGLILVLAAAAAPAAQSVPASPAVETASAVTADATTAVYTIPATDELPETMSFSLEEAQFIESRSNVRLSFKLPADLVGENNRAFTLVGRPNSEVVNLSGRGANALCASKVDRTDCQISFDPKAIEELQEENDTGAPIDPLVKAGRESFAHQAVGTLTFFKN